MSGPAPANLKWLDHSVIDNNIVVIEDSPVTFRWRQIGDMPTHNDTVLINSSIVPLNHESTFRI